MLFHRPTYTFAEINKTLQGAMESLKDIVDLILANKPQKPIKFTLPFPEADFYYTLHKVEMSRYSYIHIHKHSIKDDKEIGTLTAIAIIDEIDAITDTLYHIQVDAITTLIACDVKQKVVPQNKDEDVPFV